MVGELPTPIDQVTGLPLPILPTEPPKGALFRYKNYHHHFHPSTSPELQGTDGKAVRQSRGQLIPAALHRRYHDLFRGPRLPTTTEEKFRACVLSCAGVIPPKAIDLSEVGTYQEVTMSEEQMANLSPSIYIQAAYKGEKYAQYIRDNIGRFFAEYAVAQCLNIDGYDRKIEQFLSPRTRPTKRHRIGNQILCAALDISLEDIEVEHAQLRQDGYVAPDASSPTAVVYQLFPAEHYRDYHEPLRATFNAAIAA